MVIDGGILTHVKFPQNCLKDKGIEKSPYSMLDNLHTISMMKINGIGKTISFLMS